MEQRVGLADAGKSRAQDLVVDLSFDGASLEVSQACKGHRDVDVSSSGHELVEALSRVAKVADVAGSGVYFYHGAGNFLQADVAAGGGDVHVAVGDLAKGNGPAESLDVDVSVADGAGIHRRGGAFENEIPFQIFGRQRTGSGAENDACVSGDKDLIVDVVGLGTGRHLGACRHLDAVLVLLVENFHSVGMHDGGHHTIHGRRGDCDSTVLVADGNDRVSVYFIGKDVAFDLGGGRDARCQDQKRERRNGDGPSHGQTPIREHR